MPFIVPAHADPASLSLRDAGNEAASFLVYGAILTAGNFAAQQTAWGLVVDDAMALVLGAKATTNYGNKVDYAWDQPTNGAAREIALLVQAKDAVTSQRLTAKLPTLDPTIPQYVDNINARDVVVTSAPSSIVTFVTDLQAFWKNPYTGNAVVIIGLKVVRGLK